MGNTQGIPEAHVRIYSNTMAIQDPATRVQMIRTLIRSPEHIESMKRAGIYGKLLHFIQQVESGSAAAPAAHPVKANQQLVTTTPQRAIQSSQKGNERAMNYFSACLRILQIEEEVAVTVEGLKAAYKKAVIRAHPDKGGSEKEFEAVTRAYAYLGEILERIHGGRAAEGKVEAPTALANNRASHEEKWKMVEPVRLNPAKLDTQTFNDMFEKTKIPDPDESGYGDWLKGGDSASTGPKFGGKFNRDVFNKAFEDEQKGRSGNPVRPAQGAIVAQELSMASRMGYGVELGRTGRDDYTVSPNENGLKFTDLKKAYTDYSTFSQDIAGVRVENRSVQQYQAERESAPVVFTDTEREQLQAAERQMAQAEERRKLRVAQEAVEEGSYFERMKRLVIRN